jgi:hypothetical protein
LLFDVCLLGEAVRIATSARYSAPRRINYEILGNSCLTLKRVRG